MSSFEDHLRKQRKNHRPPFLETSEKILVSSFIILCLPPKLLLVYAIHTSYLMKKFFSAKPARNQKQTKSVVSISSINIGQTKPTTLRGKKQLCQKKENTQHRAKKFFWQNYQSCKNLPKVEKLHMPTVH